MVSRKDRSRLAGLRNLGPVSEQWLAEVGIHSPKQLRQVGPVAAYRRVKAARPQEVNLVMLWALVGALLDRDFRSIPPDLKDQLKRELHSATHEGGDARAFPAGERRKRALKRRVRPRR